ncbi:glycosyltransferase family 39 protein [Kitasatospora sp. NPDC096147]|uniref:glycosyltransferase family 39 protein n=1 Tax=Kitasatospora sp. NPDC096147 TaxID=3364093 RepID=UPI003812B0F2
MSPHRTLTWLLPALLTLAVGLLGISTPELWRDELATWSATSRNWPELFGMLGRVDASHGAYYLLMHVWSGLFGSSVPALRLPSALAMAGAAAFAALTARRVYGSGTAGLAAGLLLATVPTVSRYAQEARSYALVTCAVAAGSWLLLRALDRPTVGHWAWYGLAVAAGGVLHLVSLAALAGHAALVLTHRRSDHPVPDPTPTDPTPAHPDPTDPTPTSPADATPGFRRPTGPWLLTVLPALLPAVPVALLGRSQSGRQLGWLGRPGAEELRLVWAGILDSHEVLSLFCLLAGLALLRPGRTRAAVRVLLLGTLPVVAVWLLSQGPSSYFLARYLLFTVPAWAALAGGGVAAAVTAVARVAPRRLAAAVAVSLVLLSLALGAFPQLSMRQRYGHSGYVAFGSDDRDYRGAAALVAAGYRPGDGIVPVAGEQAWAMVGPGIAYHLPSGVRPPPLLVERSAVQADDLYPVECPAPAHCLGTAPRTWVVNLATVSDPLTGLTSAQTVALRAEFTVARVQYVRGLTVVLLVRR